MKKLLLKGLLLATMLVISLGVFAQSKYKVNPLEKGYRGFVEFGITAGAEFNKWTLTTSHGYQFNPHLFAGIGLGAQRYHKVKAGAIPFFAHFRSEIFKNPSLPFADIKIGYSIGDAQGLYFEPTIGYRFAISGYKGLSLGVGYSLQRSEDIYNNAYPTVNIDGFIIKASFDF